MPAPKSFSEQLKIYRTDMALTQKELAKQWGFSTETISAWERAKRVPSRQQIQRLSTLLEMGLDELMQSIRVTVLSTDRHKSQEGNNIEIQQGATILEHANQKSCEAHIKEASLHAKKIKILTIRGDKYFVGSMSLLAHLFSSERTAECIIQVLVLSPDSQHITNELAEKLNHVSAEEIREKMRLTLAHLMLLSRRNKNFQLKYYFRKPNFKILLFDDILFVSSFVAAKNDFNARMYQLKRMENPLFTGFERIFDELWIDAVYPGENFKRQ